MRLFLLANLLLVAAPAFAQTSILEGSVRDTDSGDGCHIRERVPRSRYIPGDSSLGCKILRFRQVAEGKETKQETPQIAEKASFETFLVVPRVGLRYHYA